VQTTENEVPFWNTDPSDRAAILAAAFVAKHWKSRFLAPEKRRSE
jgi:hypothetical protein